MVAQDAALMAHVNPNDMKNQLKNLSKEFNKHKKLKDAVVSISFFQDRMFFEQTMQRGVREIKAELQKLKLTDVEFREVSYPTHEDASVFGYAMAFGTVAVDGSDFKNYTRVYLEDQRILVIRKGKVTERTPSLSPSPPSGSRRSPSADPRIKAMQAERERSTSSERTRRQLELPRSDLRRLPSPDPQPRLMQQAQQEPPRFDPRQVPRPDFRHTPRPQDVKGKGREDRQVPQSQDVKGKGREDKSRSRSPRDEEETTQRRYQQR